MTVLVLEQHFLPIIEIHALIKAGSAQDPPEKAGLANLVAGLLDEGTTTRSSKQLAEQIDFVGGSLGAQADEDFTTASARTLKKDIDLGFTLLADILQRPAFPKQEFERVRSQILGEIASDNDDPGHVAMKAFNQLIFQNHPYRWPVNGTEDTLGKITLADVQTFYAKEYLPNQVILTIVGDVTAGTSDDARPDSFRILEERDGATQNGQEAGCHRQKNRAAHRKGSYTIDYCDRSSTESVGPTLIFTPSPS